LRKLLKQDNGKPDMIDKIELVNELRGIHPSPSLARNSAGGSLAGLVIDNIVREAWLAERRAAAATIVAPGQAPVDREDEAVNPRMLAELYEVYGKMTSAPVDLAHRVQQVVKFYHMFSNARKLSEWLSRTKVSLGGLQTSNRREITLSGGGAREAKLPLSGDETAGDKKDLTHEESRVLGYILVTMLAAVLTQVIADNEYPGYEESGKDYLHGKGKKKPREAWFEQWRSSRSTSRRRNGPNHPSRRPSRAPTLTSATRRLR
jgi:hypothetical protein